MKKPRAQPVPVLAPLAPNQSPDPLLSLIEAGAHLSLSVSTIRRMIRAKLLRAFKVRGFWRIKQSDLDKFIDECQRGTIAYNGPRRLDLAHASGVFPSRKDSPP